MIDWESSDAFCRQIVEHLMEMSNFILVVIIMKLKFVSILLVKNSLWSKKDEGPSVSALFLK
jgi:hypothetical protein